MKEQLKITIRWLDLELKIATILFVCFTDYEENI